MTGEEYYDLVNDLKNLCRRYWEQSGATAFCYPQKNWAILYYPYMGYIHCVDSKGIVVDRIEIPSVRR